jgi:cobalt-zinc-cadmium efflux system membrane fusion protein
VLFVRPRFAGVVHAMHKQVGDAVRRGETVATIQSNESLTDYAVPSSIAGRVVTRGAAVGQAVTQDATLYTIVDVSRVWVDLPIYPHQIGAIRRGQTVRITRSGGGDGIVGAITYVGPLLAEDTRVSVARVVLDNRGGGWDPGLFVNASVVTDRARAAVAVPDAAVVRSGDGSAVFVVHQGGFDLRPVGIGRTDGRTTEITSGLAAGDSVVVRNAYVLKAELEKEAE